MSHPPVALCLTKSLPLHNPPVRLLTARVPGAAEVRQQPAKAEFGHLAELTAAALGASAPGPGHAGVFQKACGSFAHTTDVPSVMLIQHARSLAASVHVQCSFSTTKDAENTVLNESDFRALLF